MSKISEGYCQCGCGQKTKMASSYYPGYEKGQYLRYVHGHNNMGLRKEETSQWKGGKHIHKGYVMKRCREHPRAQNCYVPEHILIAEEVLGEYLPNGAVIHHIDGNKLNNIKSNLVICQNESYHQLIHKKMKQNARLF